MLSTLDTVIAFAVIMTVLSLLITIIVQMVSAGLSLRGKNLANALSLTFQTIDPRLGEQAHSLAAQILRDPIFSDSMWRRKSRLTVPMVIDAGTQALIKAERWLKLAEQDLATNRDETKQTLREHGVTEAKAAVQDAKRNVTIRTVEPNRAEPWGFWSWPWGGATQLGSAIRPGEIYRILHEFHDLTETEAALRDIPPKLIKASADLIAVLRKKDHPTEESQMKLGLIGKVSDYFKDEAQRVAVVNSLASFGTTVERATTQAYDRFQRWFDSSQDRAEQWFQMHTRIVTIVSAIAVAFLLQLDTLEIYRQLRASPKLVDALVKSAPGVLEQGVTVLDQNDNSAYYTYLLWLKSHPLFPLDTLPTPGTPETYRRDLAARIKLPPNPSYPTEEFKRTLNRAAKLGEGAGDPKTNAIQSAYESWIEKFPKYKLDPPPAFQHETGESLTEKIAAKVNKDAEEQKSAQTGDWISEYDRVQPEGVKAFEKAHAKIFADLKGKIEAAGFDLAPTPLFSRWEGERVSGWLTGMPRPLAIVLRHILGLLVTAGLLSLGAPFWFNVLKNLMSLRPAVASLIEKRPTSAPALPAAPVRPSSSS